MPLDKYSVLISQEMGLIQYTTYCYIVNYPATSATLACKRLIIKQNWVHDFLKNVHPSCTNGATLMQITSSTGRSVVIFDPKESHFPSFPKSLYPPKLTWERAVDDCGTGGKNVKNDPKVTSKFIKSF